MPADTDFDFCPGDRLVVTDETLNLWLLEYAMCEAFVRSAPDSDLLSYEDHDAAVGAAFDEYLSECWDEVPEDRTPVCPDCGSAELEMLDESDGVMAYGWVRCFGCDSAQMPVARDDCRAGR